MRRVLRPRLPQATHISDALDGMLKQLGLDEKMKQVRALVIWDEVVGPQIAAHTRPIRVRDDVLEVNVAQPAWMQQLQLMKSQVLKKLNAELGERPLKSIYLKQGRIKLGMEAKSRPTPPWENTKLDPDEEKDLASLLSGIEDAALKNELETYLGKQLRLAKSARRSFLRD